MLVDLGGLCIYSFVMLVGNIADYLFEQIFESNDAFESAMFADDEPEMLLCFLHLAQDVFESRSIDRVEWWLQSVFDCELLGMKQAGHHVFAVNKAARVV